MNEWTSDNAFEERTSNARPWSWESKNLTTRSRHSRGVQSVKMFFLKNDQTRKVFVFKSKLRADKDNIRPYTFLSFSVTKCWNKSSPISSISCPKVTASVLLKKIMLLRIAQQVAKHLGYFCKKIGCHQLLFIAQSGHAATVQFLSIKIDLKVLNWFGRIELAEKLAEPSFSCLTSGLS